ncbi:hypothetical protein SNE35_05790 [Paucibacter sp. R3-3]|uniref:Uncharacterized protein n=1 Tax=Roseateles agri TaxID=3098619 RepID=A0ABU5DCJ0_9BURK|nr:hypothetical protein [Paucibacter sp. R3-3]MDY0744004.1 hypothetical protein [Paucibacter sp. R3-3]
MNPIDGMLSSELSSEFFSESMGHLAVRLTHLPNARVLWINPRYSKIDPTPASRLAPNEYVDHIKETCAKRIFHAFSENIASRSSVGIADRYGGSGIGNNGGSGRACVIDGYSIKGIGRTPLVGNSKSTTHISGDFFLEECIRETIFGELVDAEFPYGAIPTLAILDTGQVEFWDAGRRRVFERRSLMVRPSFLRPAHFMRAPMFLSMNPCEGSLDSQRVKLMLKKLSLLNGPEAGLGLVRSLANRWAKQLAYAYIHRISLGGPSPSNISISGQMVDFGGASALRSLAQICTQLDIPATGQEIFRMLQEVRVLVTFVCKNTSNSKGESGISEEIFKEAHGNYFHTISIELLRLCGLTGHQAEKALASQNSNSIARSINILISHYRTEHVAMFGGEVGKLSFDLIRIWDETPPWHLSPLKADILKMGQLFPASIDYPLIWKQRCRWRCKDRARLDRDSLRWRIYDSLEDLYQKDMLNQDGVTSLIQNEVLAARVDSKIDFDAQSIVGFRISDGDSFVQLVNMYTDSQTEVLERHSKSYITVANPLD